VNAISALTLLFVDYQEFTRLSVELAESITSSGESFDEVDGDSATDGGY
jgi:hypothetical protein